MSKISFLPNSYEAPRTAGSYMKIQDGENKIRILSAPVMGWEDWTTDKKPVRFTMDNKPSKSIDPKRPVKHFWAFIVWNYAEERIQIMQVTQATIRTTLATLCKDSDWGDPFFYDIKISKSGEGKDTEYTVTPLPHKPLSDHIKEAFLEKRCNLDALFEGADPFAEWDQYTPGAFENMEQQEKQQMDLIALLNECTPEFQQQIRDFCVKNKIDPDLSNVPSHLYERLERYILKTHQEQKAS